MKRGGGGRIDLGNVRFEGTSIIDTKARLKTYFSVRVYSKIGLRNIWIGAFRSLQDRGLLVLLDNRILKKAYGKVFLESLPDYRRTIALQDVEEFFGVN